MRRIFYFFVCVISMNAFSESGPDLSQNWTVVSDERDPFLEAGTFLIQGTVHIFSSAAPLEGVQVSASTTEEAVYTDSAGNFRLKCSVKEDRQIYFYLFGWSEIVMVNYPFKDRHRVTISVYMNEQVDAVKRKPVIYLYGDQERDVRVELDPRGEFTFTYPEYKNDWQVRVRESGQITDLKSGKKVPYLFWEARTTDLFYQTDQGTIPGFLIATDTVVDFLEGQLFDLGLNETEQTDFITFWGPLLQAKPFALVQFLVDDVYEKAIAGLKITPAPDAIRKVFMICSPLDDLSVGMPVSEQKFKKFERKGFTVVEWGGTTIDLSTLKPH